MKTKAKEEIKVRKWLPSHLTVTKIVPAKKGGKYRRDNSWKRNNF